MDSANKSQSTSEGSPSKKRRTKTQNEMKPVEDNKGKQNTESNNTNTNPADEVIPSSEQDINLDESVNMVDVMKQQEETELEAMAVLGGSDENNCTYSKGYIKRQALYSCLTCVPESRHDAEKRAGICLACSLTCHENHELIELYTKRNFRCDCGGAKLTAIRCKLEPIKFGLNEDNNYNHNFSGLYCTCERPYPDPEDTIVDEMIQCVMCEDWYHGRHLNTPVLKDFCEMTCGLCMDKFDFLCHYLDLAVLNKDKTTEGEVNVEALDTSTATEGSSDQPEAKRMKLDDNACRKPPKQDHKKETAVFWQEEWREKLCKCKDCYSIYKTYKAEFLLDPDDSVQKYEEIGIQRTRQSTSQEREMQALSQLNRTQQVDLITEYNRFRDRLKEYLHAFVVNKQTVTEEDINRFFTMMKSEKAEKQGLPYFCR